MFSYLNYFGQALKYPKIRIPLCNEKYSELLNTYSEYMYLREDGSLKSDYYMYKFNYTINNVIEKVLNLKRLKSECLEGLGASSEEINEILDYEKNL